MYIREEEIFRAIYHQLNEFLKKNAISLLQYRSRKTDLQREVAQCEKNLDNAYDILRGYYEQMVSKKISKEEYLRYSPEKDDAGQILADAESKLEKYENIYRKQEILSAVSEKVSPLSALMDYVEKISINESKKIEVHFSTIYGQPNNPDLY